MCDEREQNIFFSSVLDPSRFVSRLTVTSATLAHYTYIPPSLYSFKFYEWFYDLLWICNCFSFFFYFVSSVYEVNECIITSKLNDSDLDFATDDKRAIHRCLFLLLRLSVVITPTTYIYKIWKKMYNEISSDGFIQLMFLYR